MSSLTIKTFSAWPKITDPLDEESLQREEQDYCQKKAMVQNFIFVIFRKFCLPKEKKKFSALRTRTFLTMISRKKTPQITNLGLMMKQRI